MIICQQQGSQEQAQNVKTVCGAQGMKDVKRKLKLEAEFNWIIANKCEGEDFVFLNT